MPPAIPHDRLVDHIKARIRIDANGCWLWCGCRNYLGYGEIRIRGKHHGVHRLMYEMTVGPVSPDLVMDHLCRNPPCCNPAHLEPVTRSVNALRGNVAAANHHAKKTHCVRGHEYTPENTRIYRTNRGSGRGRQCKECHRIVNGAWMRDVYYPRMRAHAS